MSRARPRTFIRAALSLAVAGALAGALLHGMDFATRADIELIAQERARAATETALPELAGSQWENSALRVEAGPYRVARLIPGGSGEHFVILAPWRTYRGYNGAMDLSVALGTDGRIRRVDVLRHRETPGLGDQFLRSKTAWLDQFDGRHIADSEIDVWRVSQDDSHFDVMTGATVTSTAVVTGVREALEFARSLRQKDVGQK